MSYVPEHDEVVLTPEGELGLMLAQGIAYQVTSPLCWYDPTDPFPITVDNGSCFFMRLPAKHIAVTAAHVYRTYERHLAEKPNTVARLDSRQIELSRCLIAIDDNLDICTFEVWKTDIRAAGKQAIDCRGNWPPPEPGYRHLLHLCGFPKFLRTSETTEDGQYLSWKAFGAIPVVEHVTERIIPMSFEPERDKGFGGFPAPEPGTDLSGASGGVVLHAMPYPGAPFLPVALIAGGANKQIVDERVPQRGDADTFDTMELRRIHFIQEDGRINNPFPARPLILG